MASRPRYNKMSLLFKDTLYTNITARQSLTQFLTLWICPKSTSCTNYTISVSPTFSLHFLNYSTMASAVPTQSLSPSVLPISYYLHSSLNISKPWAAAIPSCASQLTNSFASQPVEGSCQGANWITLRISKQK
uniref:Uncharacterized protein n=1 Tax=Pipistrellus kuhlii TaxID=59472 RepID=A0A7J7XBY5_PIPKU|nr:hypothetical protein mPipKuh1_010641 [Pipistrellus kuhlii]